MVAAGALAALAEEACLMLPSVGQLDETTALTQRAQTLVDLGRPAEALPLLHRALGQTPDDDEALCLLSLAHWNLAQHEEALAWAERAVTAWPDGLWAHQLLACHLFNLGYSKRSLVASLEAVRLGPENAKGLKILGRAQLASNDVAAAQETARQMQTLAPDSELTYELLTLIAVHQGRWAEVETHCRAALAIQPNAYISLAYLGQALDKQTPSHRLRRDPGRLPEAIDCLGRAVQIAPAESMARQSLAATLGRYLMSDWIVPPLGLCLVILVPSVVSVWSIGTVPALVGGLWALCALFLAPTVPAIRVSRQRFRALPSFVQQFWRQHCIKTLGTRCPWL